ncbi:MAG: 16S rRNA (guanine(527)-N(7))-methyltransferase RsmG [Bacilli bacterium]|nr:16S rRNA (guanine(527)-N(7))-methyltransferase RsmG [Bacilli bacterium]
MNKEQLINELLLRGINPSSKQVDELFHLMQVTLETNEKFNLTAIKEEGAFLEKMIFDSAIAMQDLDLSDKKVIDIGTGAGFPGLVLYIFNPQMHLTLLDSTNKKIDYLAGFCGENQYDINCVCSRAEEYQHREEYDYAFARAVASLNILLELIIPMVKVGGHFIALKGQGFEEEIKASQGAMKKLGCHLEKIIEDTLPECDEQRVMIYIVKDKETHKKYPRSYADIKKLPL